MIHLATQTKARGYCPSFKLDAYVGVFVLGRLKQYLLYLGLMWSTPQGEKEALGHNW